MDAQSDIRTVAGLAALVHGLALHEARMPSPAVDTGILMESSFRAARDGLRATIWFDGKLRPVPEVARKAVRLARRHVDAPALQEVERILTDGNGADRQRAVHAKDGMDGLVRHLATETLGVYA
jgi:carboxylate-amine ligase